MLQLRSKLRWFSVSLVLLLISSISVVPAAAYDSVDHGLDQLGQGQSPTVTWLREEYGIDLESLASGLGCVDPVDPGLIAQDSAKYGLVSMPLPVCWGKYKIAIPDETFGKIKKEVVSNRAGETSTAASDTMSSAWFDAIESAVRHDIGMTYAHFQISTQPLCNPATPGEQAGVGVVVRMLNPTTGAVVGFPMVWTLMPADTSKMSWSEYFWWFYHTHPYWFWAIVALIVVGVVVAVYEITSYVIAAEAAAIYTEQAMELTPVFGSLPHL
ncbi:MAG: hypothetical protein METHP_01488 [Methanoregula sp. SKADARSKE-2]|nr:MAG: hypothetical protein METHP_01488 [Methanoregula sp. SKADARSKE-2]